MQAYNFKKLSTIHALCKIHLDAEMEKVFMYNNILYEKKIHTAIASTSTQLRKR